MNSIISKSYERSFSHEAERSAHDSNVRLKSSNTVQSTKGNARARSKPRPAKRW